MTEKKEIKTEDLNKASGGSGGSYGRCRNCGKTYSDRGQVNSIYRSSGCDSVFDHYECPSCGGTVDFNVDNLRSWQ